MNSAPGSPASPASPSPTELQPSLSKQDLPPFLHSSAANDTASARRNRKVSSACERCRKLKRKCNAERPSCRLCVVNNQTCLYQHDDGRKTNIKSKQINSLEAKVEFLEATLEALKLGTDSEAAEALRQLRSEGGPSTASSSSVQPPRLRSKQKESISLSGEAIREIWSSNSDVNARQSDSPLSSESLHQMPSMDQTRTYSPSNLPPEESMRVGLNAFFMISAGLFYVMNEQEAEAVFDRVYRSTTPVDLATLSELCALAAIGSHYDSNGVPNEIKDAFVKTSALSINDCIEAGSLRGMRVLVCLAAYGFIEKRNSARVSIASGLQLARWNWRHQDKLNPQEMVSWRKLYRTLVFLECWLSTTLGYVAELTPFEIEFTTNRIEEVVQTEDNEPQARMSQIGLLKAIILREMYTSKPPDLDVIENNMVRLKRWRESLGPAMQLSALTSSPEQTDPLIKRHRGSLYLIHAMYLSAIILLHRRVLIALAESRLGAVWTMGRTPEEAMHYHHRCIEAARSSARIFVLVGFGDEKHTNMSVRCWLCIFEIFTACSLLLYDISQRFLPHYNGPKESNDSIDDDLKRAQACITMLGRSSSADQVAERVRGLVIPVYESLRALQKKASEKAAESGHSDLEQFLNDTTDSASSGKKKGNVQVARNQISHEAIPAAKAAVDLLKNPFGHESTMEDSLLARQSNESPSWWV